MNRVIRISHWKAFDYKRREYENVWGPRFFSLLKKVGKDCASAYQATRSETSAVSVVDRELNGQLSILMRKMQHDVASGFLPLIDKSVQEKKDDRTRVEPEDIPEMQDYFSRVTATRVTQVSDATKAYLQRTIERGIRNGDSITDLVDEIENNQAFSRYRSFLIARTEVISASNASTHFGIKRFMSVDGMTKDWLATGDQRTRPTHRDADATQKSIPYEKPFQVGGSSLMFPGDASLGASAKELIQCRCTATYYADPYAEPPPPANLAPPPPEIVDVEIPRVPLSRKPNFTRNPADFRTQFLQEVDFLEKTIVDAETRMSDAFAKQFAYYSENELVGSVAENPLLLDLQEATKIYDELILLKKTKLADFLADSLASETSGTMKTTIKSKVFKSKSEVESGLKFLNKIVGNLTELSDLEIEVYVSRSGRAYQTQKAIRSAQGVKYQQQIFLGKTEDVATVIHEIGHAIERKVPDLYRAVNELWDRRTAGESFETLRSVTGNRGYRTSEKTKKDNWIDAYMGKIYRGTGAKAGLTELTSMSLELLWKDPVTLMTKDPELFDVIYNVLRRALP